MRFQVRPIIAVVFVVGVMGVSVNATDFGSDPICLVPPVPGPVVGEYAPVGKYQGHWGVDLAAKEGSPVLAPIAGEVTFAGEVVGTLAVTVRDHAGNRVSVSSLGSLDAAAGDRVEPGDKIGRSGRHRGRSAVHLSWRDGDGYRDPEPLLGCAAPGRVRLIPVSEAISS